MTDGRDEGDESDVDVFERAGAGLAPEHDQRWVELPPASMLSVEDADGLLRWRPASLVAVVGERNGGKTTLVTELYERFLRGPFADALFAHSLSLLGFELKCFEARAESGGEVPDTPRTSAQAGLRFFHLGLADAADLRRTDLLISERAGEVYREIRDTPSRAMELVEVRKAASVAFIVDGERVAQDRRRPEAFASVRGVLRGLADSGAIAPSARIQLVTTKCDLLGGEAAAGALEALAEFERVTAEAYAGRFAEVSSFRTAARDPTGGLEPAYGVAPLLRTWLRPASLPVPAQAPVPELHDEFDRLLVRRAA